MEAMNLPGFSGEYKITNEEVLASLHGLAILLVHKDAKQVATADGKHLSLREIAERDTFYSRRKTSLFMELLAGAGEYSAKSYMRLLDTQYGKGTSQGYMPQVNTLYETLKAECGITSN